MNTRYKKHLEAFKNTVVSVVRFCMYIGPASVFCTLLGFDFRVM